MSPSIKRPVTSQALPEWTPAGRGVSTRALPGHLLRLPKRALRQIVRVRPATAGRPATSTRTETVHG